MRRVPPSGFIIIGIAATAALAWFVLRPAPRVASPVPQPPGPAVIADPYGSLQPFMEGIYAADRAVEPPEGYRIRGVIVPHHLAAPTTIAAGFRMLEHQEFTHVLLVSPDHFDRCPTLLCTADATYETGFGEVRAAPEALAVLRGSPLVTDSPELFTYEHGVHAVMPFLKHYRPSVRVTPLVVSQRLPWKTEKTALLDLLSAAVDDDALLVVSSDFSHYLPLAEADVMDELAAEALFANDLDGIASLKAPEQSDCPGCLWIMAALADKRGFSNPSVVMHTNSASIIGDEDIPETTSHFAIVWYENAHLDGADIALAGDVTVTRGAPAGPSETARAWWSGTGPRAVNLEGPLAEACSPQENPYLFCNELGAWAPFKDLATHWGVMNNHMLDLGTDGLADTIRTLRKEDETPITSDPTEAGEWRVIALTTLVNPVDDATAARVSETEAEALAALRDGAAGVPTAVLVHGGGEYRVLAGDADDARWERFIDAGADAVAVSHGHMPGDVRIYNGRPIFRGLGNFLFDQQDRAATSTAKLVRLRYDDGRVLFETLLAPSR